MVLALRGARTLPYSHPPPFLNAPTRTSLASTAVFVNSHCTHTMTRLHLYSTSVAWTSLHTFPTSDPCSWSTPPFTSIDAFLAQTASCTYFPTTA